MKYFLIFFSLIFINLNAQNILKFDKRNVQCEDKWVSYQMNKDSIYSFGFIYIDSQAGLTLNYEGDFKINKTGNFVRIEPKEKRAIGFMKVRLQPNRVAIARFVQDIPSSPADATWQLLDSIEKQLPGYDNRPVNLVWGMRDWCFRPECLHRFQKLLPHAQTQELSDVGHYVMEEAADEVLAALRSQLRRYALDY